MARVGSLLLLLAAVAASGDIPVTAMGAIARWPKLPGREFSSDLKLSVAVLLPDAEEAASVCMLGPVGRLGYAQQGVKIPPCWSWHVELADPDAGDDFVAALAEEIRAKGIPGADLRHGSRISDAGLARLKGLAGVRFLGLSGTAVTDAGLAALLPLPELVALDLNGCMGLTASGLAGLKPLEDLAWLGLRMTRADDGTAAFLAGMKNLQALELGETLVTDRAMRGLKRLKGLRGLGLASTQVGDGGLAELKALPALEALDLSLARATAKSLPALASLKRLSWLSLSGLALDDDDLAGWRGGAALTELDLTETKAGDRALAAIATHGILRRLQLKGDAFTDRGLEALYLHCCSRVTDAGIALLGGKPIRSLGLRGNTRLTDAGVARLAALAKLRNLDLGGCRRVTAKAIGDLRAALPGLTSLRGPEETFGPSTPARPDRPRGIRAARRRHPVELRRMKSSLLLIPILIVGLAGCGGSPHEKALESAIDLMAEMNDVLDGVKDVKSAEAAAPKLKELRKRQDEAEKTMSALGTPKEDELKEMEEMRKKFQAQMTRLAANQARLVQIPGVQQVLDEAMSSGR